MNRNDLFEAMEYIDEKIIEKSEGNITVKFQKKYSKRTILLVAVLCTLMIFATAAVAAKIFGLKDALVDTKNPEIKSEISLFGFAGSNEYKAAAEWKAFEEGYDPDGSLLAQSDPEGPGDFYIGDKYLYYSVYTQEMADKLDEIAAKYGLQLYGSQLNIGMDEITAKLIVNDPAEFSDAACNTLLNGYIFESGTFSFDGIFDASAGRLSADYQFRRSVKGVLDPIFLNIGDIADYQEKTLTTDSGITFAAAISADKSVLIAEFDSCFVSINVMGGADIGITFDDLADLLNTFDFSVLENISIAPALDGQSSTASEPEQELAFIEISREGVAEKLPVQTVRTGSFSAAIAMAPEYFTHNALTDADTFTYDAWTGEREVYFTLSRIAQSSPDQLCEKLIADHGENYTGRNVTAVKIGPYDAIAVLFDGETASPSYQRHFFIIQNGNDCILIETQFDFEMYEGLYRIMLALFDTLTIG